MPNFALVKNNIVENVVVVESLEDAQKFFIDFTILEVDQSPEAPSIGYTYDGTSFHPPVIEETTQAE